LPIAAGSADPNLQSILEALLVFFFTLSIRMRIDRLDGVKEIVWADDFSVLETLNGFLEGLEGMPLEKTREIPLAECFEFYLLSLDEQDLLRVAGEVVDHYHPHAPERKVIQKNLEAHVGCVKQALIKRHLSCE